MCYPWYHHEFLGDDFVLVFWRSIWRILNPFFRESIPEEWDLSDGEVWECVTIVRLTKWHQTCHTNLTTWSQNCETWNSWFCRKRNISSKLLHQKIKIAMKFVTKQLNSINFDQILHSNIFPILWPKFSKNHDFKIYRTHIKFPSK